MAATSELVCFMDCDASLDPRDLPRVSGPVLRSEADLCLRERCPERGAWSPHARVANLALALELRRRCEIRLRDPGPMRAAWRKGLLGLDLRDRRSGWPLEMVLRSAEAR